MKRYAALPETRLVSSFPIEAAAKLSSSAPRIGGVAVDVQLCRLPFRLRFTHEEVKLSARCPDAGCGGALYWLGYLNGSPSRRVSGSPVIFCGSCSFGRASRSPFNDRTYSQDRDIILTLEVDTAEGRARAALILDELPLAISSHTSIFGAAVEMESALSILDHSLEVWKGVRGQLRKSN